MIGWEPGPRSLRELFWGLEAKQIDDWNHTCRLESTVINAAPFRRRRLIRPGDLHPYLKRRPKPRRSREEMIANLNQMVGLKDASQCERTTSRQGGDRTRAHRRQGR
jgi:hypothetical protein